MKLFLESPDLAHHDGRPAASAAVEIHPDWRKPGVNRQAWCGLALVLADLCALVLAVVGAAGATWSLRALGIVGAGWGSMSPYAPASLLLIAFIGFGAMTYWAAQAHYGRRTPFWNELRQVMLASVAALLCYGFVKFSRQEDSSRLLPVLVWLLFPVFVVALRALARRILSQLGLWRIPALIVGEGDAARQVADALLSEPGLGYDVTAMVGPDAVGHGSGWRPWTRAMQRFGAELLVLVPGNQGEPGRQAIEGLVRERVPFAVMPPPDGLPVLGFDKTHFFSHDTVMFSFRNNLAKPAARFVKIAFDVTATLAGLLVVCPVFLAIAVLVKLDGGPVVFAHRRIGAGGRSFRCFKFRSMRTDSDEVLREVLARDPQARLEWAEGQKLRDDPRVTWIGKHLRRASLDELPQLLNVLRLEMSLVGPRPIVQGEVERYGHNIAYYYETRPGLTGLWQVSGRSDTSYAQRVHLDTWYVKNWTLWHDIAILAKTLPAVLKRQGAH